MTTFILTCYGITLILTQGSIFEGVRTLLEKVWNKIPLIKKAKSPFRCSMCVGFWVGLAMSFVLPTQLTLSVPYFVNFLLACVSSGTSYILVTSFSDKGFRVSKK
jgi:hypothetical protein